MKTLSRIMILTFLLLSIGCSKDDNEVPVVPKSGAKALISFVFNTDDNAVLVEGITATIGEESKSIVASVPSGTDITALSPSIQVSEKANVSPEGPQDFSSPIIYTVTAEDDSSVTYEVTITVSASDAKQLTSFVLTAEENEGLPDDNRGTINTANDIFLTVPGTVDVTSLKPTITVSPGASVSPTGEMDFSNPVVYTVIAADGSTQEYTVQVSISISQKDALIAITTANPEFNLDWSLNKPIEEWEGVTVENGLVTGLLLSNANIKVIPEEIEVLIAMRTLNLNKNGLTAIPSELYKLSSLVDLRMRDNSISVLADNIGNLDKLITLELSGNQLKELPEEIGELSFMTHFSFSSNNVVELPAAIGGLKSLVSITAQNNGLIGLPEEIGLLPELEFIFVDDNSIKSLPESIGQLEKLNALLIQNNSLTTLPVNFNGLKSLQIFDVSNNPLGKLPVMDNLQNLEYLGLSNTKLRTVPEEIFALSNLVSISIDNNEIEELPENLFSLKQLKYLNVSNNLLTALSPMIQNLVLLENLDLSDNKITSLPKEIAKLQNIVSFIINNNQISELDFIVCDWIEDIRTFFIDDNVTCR